MMPGPLASYSPLVTSSVTAAGSSIAACRAATLACRVSTRAASTSTLNRSEQGQQALSWSPARLPAQQDAPAPSDTLPKLQPISRSLARELQREQRLKKRLRKKINNLQRQLQLQGGQSSILTDQDSFSLEEVLVSDDPLFSCATPPSVEQLQRRLVHVRRQLLQASSESLNDVLTITSKLQDMASCLRLSLDLVVPMVARHEPLLLQQPQQLPARLALLSSALQLSQINSAELLAASAPQLLATPLHKLQSNLGQLQRVLSSRGLNPAEVLRERPDLLCQNPSSIEAKLEALPGALGMPRQHVRQLVGDCPQLLRRSVAIIQQRYRSLCQLFSIPDSFVEEFVLQEPELLCISAPTLKAKFESLVHKYGAFSDDVVDMVLVDPAMLLNADPAAATPAPTVKASRKKQQQQQQQQGLAAANRPSEDRAQSGNSMSSPAAVQAEPSAADAVADAAAAETAAVIGTDTPPLSDAEFHLQAATVAEVAFADAGIDTAAEPAEPEVWQLVLQQRVERQKAARQRQRLRRQAKHQLQQQLLGLGSGDQPPQQQQQQLLDWTDMQLDAAAAAVVVGRQSSAQAGGAAVSRTSPVRQLVAFAAATGLSASRALLLWQQEPALAQLPTAVITAQVSRLSAALGLDGAAAAASYYKQQQAATASASAAVGNSDSSSSSSSGDSSRPILQVLVKEPALLVLPPSQVQINMQGLCDLLSLERRTGLLPLLWQQPGLLQLTPEVAEYRLQHLAGLLQLSVPRALGLILQQPQLLVERPVLLAARLGSLCTLLGVQRGVASECVLREPLLLCVDDEELLQRWQQLCARVGWADDALDVVLADPSALMRGELF